MRIEFIDDAVAVVMTDNLENILKAAQTLVNTEIDACTITTIDDVPFLSLKSNGQDIHLAILIDKTGVATPEEFFGIKKKEELEDFPLDEKIEEFDLDAIPAEGQSAIEKKEEPVVPATEEPQEGSDLIITNDMKSLMYALREGRKSALTIISNGKNNVSTTLLNRYTEITGIDLRNQLRGGDPGDSMVSLNKTKEYKDNQLLLKRDVKKKHHDFSVQKRDLPGYVEEGVEKPYAIIDTAAGKQKFYTYYGADGFQYPLNMQDIEKNAGNIIAVFSTEAERDAYYQKMVTPISPVLKTDSQEEKKAKREVMKIQKRFDLLREINSFRRELFSYLDRVEELGPNRLEKDPEYMADVNFLLWAQDKLGKLEHYEKDSNVYSYGNIYNFDETGKAVGVNEENFKTVTTILDFCLSSQMYDFSMTRRSSAAEVIANFSGIADTMINNPIINSITATDQDAIMIDYYTEKETKKKEPKPVKEKIVKEEISEESPLKGKVVAPQTPEEFFGFQDTKQKNKEKQTV